MMTALGRIRAIVLTFALAASAGLAATPAVAQGDGYMRLTAGDDFADRVVNLGVNKSMVIDLPRPAGDVLVSNPQIADAVLRTSTRLYLIGVKLGQASVFLFDNAGNQIASFAIYVEADLSLLNQLLAEAITGGYVRAEAINGSIVLRGQVASSSEASRAVEITGKMIAANPTWVYTSTSTGAAGSTASAQEFDRDDLPGVVNLLTVTGEEQVALKVTIAEVEREVVKQLGINVNANFNGDDFDIGTDAADAGGGFSPLGASLGVNSTAGQVGAEFSSGDFSLEATLQALDETNMIRTLAEPTLTAVTGETADFLAGGEFPFITGIDPDTGIATVEFKNFGVQLAFTPVVLSTGRISLKVRAEVSEITGFTSGGTPILSSRRAETTVEQPSGGAFVIAGLIQESTQRSAGGFPGLQNLPILGALFSSKAFINRETELVMIITPYLVKPVSPSALARPDDNMVTAGDAEAYFLNRLTKVYGTDGRVPGGSSAQVGFTFD
jgi:pilus assembly protein CpaC